MTMVMHTYNLKRYILLFVALLVGFFLGVAQDRSVLAHLVTDAAAGEGDLVRLDTSTSTRYTQLKSLTATTGFFYGDRQYISLMLDADEGAEVQRVVYSVTDLRLWGASEQSAEYADYLMPLSAAFHPVDSVVYINYKDGETSSYRWGALLLDSETNQLKPADVAVAEIKRPYYALCATPEGDIFGFSSDAGLYSIDKTTGEGEKLFSTGSVGKELQSAWYDDVNGVIYRAVPSSIGVTIYSYNLVDKKEIFVKVYTSIAAIVAMAPEVERVEEDVPAAVKQFSVRLGEDMTTGTICFTAPETDINGNALEGALSHVISVDKVAIDTIEVNTGEQCEYEYLFSNGAHVVSVFAINDKGRGEESVFGLFAGYDLPKPVRSVAVSCDFPYVGLKWSTPVGINGYQVDIDKLRYRVVRYPDRVLVADTAATQVTDSLASIPGSYYYGVTVYLPDYEAAETRSSTFYYDCVVDVPYHHSSWNESMLNAFLIVDANEDGATWGCIPTTSGESVMRYLYSSVNDADDYLFFPKIRLEKDRYYEATVYAHAGSEKYDEYFSAGVALYEDLSQQIELIAYERCAGKQSQPYKARFSVEQEGVYSFYVRCQSPANHHLFYIDSVAIVAAEQGDVPAAVSDMTLTTDMTNPHTVTVDFFTPTTCVDGSPLVELQNISLYRNEELIHTFEQPALGVALSYRDSVGEIGHYAYTVVAVGAAGAGVEVSRNVVCGVASFPFAHDFVEGAGYFTICDNNADGITWHYYEERFMGCMRYMASEVADADDWLISPPIYLSGGMKCQIEYNCCAGLSLYPESMRVLMGLTPQPNAMSAVLDNREEFTFIDDTRIVVPFDVPFAGNYYFAFQANSKADRYTIMLRNMAVNEYNPLSVATVDVAQCKVWSADGSIVAQSSSEVVVDVFDVAGVQVASFVATSASNACTVPSGVYIVRCGNSVHKVVVR